MKKIILMLLAIVAFAVPSSIDAAKEGQAKIRFDEVRYDFGNVKEQGGNVSHTFKFTNTGDANLVIIEATATCGCTKPEYTKKPIAPGKTGEVKVTYMPSGRPGPIDRTVTVKTNGSPKKVRLKIVGTVIPK